jgi:hypothetical protein
MSLGKIPKWGFFFNILRFHNLRVYSVNTMQLPFAFKSIINSPEANVVLIQNVYYIAHAVVSSVLKS